MRGRSHVAARWAVTLCGALVVVAAACGPSSPSATQPSGQQTSGPTLPSYELTTRQVSGLGDIVVDGRGYTVYLFLPDDHSSRSSCVNLCAVGWPPLLLPAGVSAPLAEGNLKGSLVGTTTRADGSRQVTYNGWPLYLWPNDPSPGQATGEGLNNLGGLWYVVSPTGNPIR